MHLISIMADISSVLEDPAWLMFGIAVGIGVAGLLALIVLYPFSRD